MIDLHNERVLERGRNRVHDCDATTVAYVDRLTELASIAYSNAGYFVFLNISHILRIATRMARNYFPWQLRSTPPLRSTTSRNFRP